MAAISSLFTPNPTSNFPFSNPISSQSSSHKSHQNLNLQLPNLSRREFLNGSIALIPLAVSPPSPSQAREVEVGSYLPVSPTDSSFVLFKATTKDTPALRAGNVQPYQFMLPPTWKQQRVANILSGNYCQPKCAEPWVEVKFENEKQGKVQVVASPLIRLTNKPDATIEEIGTPEKLIASLGPFVTGNSYDPDELLETSVEKIGDQTYYKYVLETPFALTGSHNLAKATAKGSTVVLFVASANDKQWPTSQKTLQAILESFVV
ncbi:psbP domain-containing protein 6, chloroplastic [Primulina huaijiensis]|uniref:psbP domain-containing protein 6, chloroplastic n=1 Tax=Primulina huaijiensis TaxID=1492673 RepID=UPI003CC77026